MNPTNLERLRHLFRSNFNICTIDPFLKKAIPASNKQILGPILLQEMWNVDADDESGLAMIHNILTWITHPAVAWRPAVQGNKGGVRAGFWQECIIICIEKRYLEGVRIVVRNVYQTSARKQQSWTLKFVQEDLFPVLDLIDEPDFTRQLMPLLLPYLPRTVQPDPTNVTFFIDMLERGCVAVLDWILFRQEEEGEGEEGRRRTVEQFLETLNIDDMNSLVNQYAHLIHPRALRRLSESDWLGREFAMTFLKELVATTLPDRFQPYLDVVDDATWQALFPRMLDDRRLWTFLLDQRLLTWSTILKQRNTDLILFAARAELPFESAETAGHVFHTCLNDLQFGPEQWVELTEHMTDHPKPMLLLIESPTLVNRDTVLECVEDSAMTGRFHLEFSGRSSYVQLADMYENDFEGLMAWLSDPFLSRIVRVQRYMPTFHEAVSWEIFRRNCTGIDPEFYDLVTGPHYKMWAFGKDPKAAPGMPRAWALDVHKLRKRDGQLAALMQENQLAKRRITELEERLRELEQRQRQGQGQGQGDAVCHGDCGDCCCDDKSTEEEEEDDKDEDEAVVLMPPPTAPSFRK